MITEYPNPDFSAPELKLEDVKPGDVLFCYSPDVANEEHNKPTKYGHVAIALANRQVLDSSNSVKIKTLEELLDDYDHIAVKRATQTWNSERLERLENFAKTHAGKSFNKIGMDKVPKRKIELEFHAWEYLNMFFEGKFNPRSSNRNSFFCSQIVVCAFIDAGIITPSASIILSPETLTPSELAQDAIFGFFCGHIIRNPNIPVPMDDYFRFSL